MTPVPGKAVETVFVVSKHGVLCQKKDKLLSHFYKWLLHYMYWVFSLAYQYIRKWTYFHLTKKNGPYSIFLKKISIHIRNACYFFYSTNATYCSSFKYFINAYRIFKEQKLRFWYIKVSRIKAFALKCYVKYFPNSLKMNNLAFYTRILISSYL